MLKFYVTKGGIRMNLVVGVDADGVLVDMHGFNVREGRKYFKKEPVNFNEYHPRDMFDVSEKEEFLYGLKVFNKYCLVEPPREDAVEVINEMSKIGCELHEITARKFTTIRNPWGSLYRKMFEHWLIRHKMDFKSIQFCSEDYTPRDKLMACRKLGVHVMIEDKPDVALYLAQNGIKVLLFDAPYNHDISGENLIRVHNWKEVLTNIYIIKNELKEINPYVPISREEKENLSIEDRVEYLKSYKEHIKNLVVNEELLKRNKRRFKLLYNLTRMPFSCIFKIKIKGKENIPYQDGFIIASNHLNSYDQFYISRALGNRQFYGLAASTVNGTIRGKVFDATGSVIYIDRDSKESKEKGEEELVTKIVNNQNALIFPEGTRKNKTEEGRKKLQLPFKLGTVSMAQKTGAAILPMSVYYGKEKYLKIGEVQYVRPEDDLVEANKKLEETILNMTLQSMEEDKVLENGENYEYSYKHGRNNKGC